MPGVVWTNFVGATEDRSVPVGGELILLELSSVKPSERRQQSRDQVRSIGPFMRVARLHGYLWEFFPLLRQRLDVVSPGAFGQRRMKPTVSVKARSNSKPVRDRQAVYAP